MANHSIRDLDGLAWISDLDRDYGSVEDGNFEILGQPARGSDLKPLFYRVVHTQSIVEPVGP